MRFSFFLCWFGDTWQEICSESSTKQSVISLKDWCCTVITRKSCNGLLSSLSLHLVLPSLQKVVPRINQVSLPLPSKTSAERILGTSFQMSVFSFGGFWCPTLITVFLPATIAGLVWSMIAHPELAFACNTLDFSASVFLHASPLMFYLYKLYVFLNTSIEVFVELWIFWPWSSVLSRVTGFIV